MARGRELRILVASDGSPSAGAAVVTTLGLPWAGRQRVQTVAASFSRGVWAKGAEAARRALDRVADGDRRALGARWPDARAVVEAGAPIVAILRRVAAFRAHVVVVGWRGHGMFRRLIAGSVSRGVVREAPCPVLVVRRPVRRARRLVIGVDGSPNARRAVAFVARALSAVAVTEVTLVQTVEAVTVPSLALIPSGIRAALRTDAAALEASRRDRAGVELERLAASLRRGGWRVRTRVPVGAPLDGLLAAADAARADVVVVGARGTGGVKRLVLGSVAEGALNHSPVPVLIVR